MCRTRERATARRRRSIFRRERDGATQAGGALMMSAKPAVQGLKATAKERAKTYQGADAQQSARGAATRE